MKNKILSFMQFQLGVMLLCLIYPFTGNAQLSGNYTINPTQSASNTNYQNWASAIGDLLSNTRTDAGNAQGPGVSGAVTFRVYDTVYTNISFEITAITGASASNTITFRSMGGDSSKCLLSNPSSATNADFILYINGADYLRFIEMGFYRTGNSSGSTVIQIGGTADFNQFTNCFFRGRKVPSNSSQGFNLGPSSCMYFSAAANNIELTNNKFLYGYNGIYCSSAGTNNRIINNIFDTSGSSGIYITGQSNLRIIGNQFRMGDFGPNQGHYTSYGMRIESSPSMVVSHNKVQMLTVNAQVVRAVIIASTTSTVNAPSLVYNNWIINIGGTGDCTGLAEYSCNYLNFYSNSVLINSPLSTSAAFFHYSNFTSTNIRVMNNNLVNKGSGYSISVSGTNISDIDSVDYNNLYSNGTYIGIWNATNYTTMSSWRSGSGKDVNSLNLDPGFFSSTDLHISSFGLNGKGVRSKWVVDDIDSEIRDTSAPDIGADEFFPAIRDVGITVLDSPYVFCAGTHNIKVRVQNYGFDTIKSLQIKWTVNSTSQTAYNWTGVLAPGSTSTPIQIGNFNFASNTSYSFVILTNNPNNAADDKPANDSLKIIKIAGLSGTYTLGDTAGTNFKSFNDAISALSARGICGAVTFNVRPGIYNEQITFLQLPGMGASNPIVFQNTVSDSSRVVITLPSTAATGNNNAAVQLRGADYVTFKGITFTRTGLTTQFAHVLHILNGSNNNTFSNCQMIGLRLTAVNLNAMTIWSDQGQDMNNTFKNNYVKFGNYNMLYTGAANARESGTVLEGNVFDSGFNQLVQLTMNDGVTVKNNSFRNVITALSGNYQIQLNDCDDAIRVLGNKFTGINSESALLISKCNTGSGTPGVIANNAVMKAAGKAIQIDSSNYQKIVFNSIYMNNASTTNAGIFTTGGTTNLELINNNIFMQGGDALYVTSGLHVAVSNYNNLYTRGSQFAYWVGTCNDLTGLNSLSGKDQNSLSVDPFFTSPFNLHVLNPLLKGAGIPVSEVTEDFDGETRNATTPDIGADEFKLSDNDAGITQLYKPIAASCAGFLPIEVIIKNYGGDTLQSATINWTVANVLQTPFAWTGSLLPKESDTIQIGNFNFLTALNPKFVIWSTLPNGQTDAIRFNDSFIGNRSMRALPNANAGADQIACAGSSVTIGPNPLAGHTYQWNDLLNQTQAGITARITVSPPTETEYEIIVTNSTFGCSRRDTVKVSVNAKPIANAGPDRSVCFGNSVQIGAATQTGFTYTWSSVPSGFSSNVANPVVTPSSTTLYVLEKTITSSGCKDLDSATVSVNLFPTPSIQGNSAVCVDSKNTYNSNLVVGNTYSWTISGGQILSGQNTNSVNVQWNTPGNGSLSLIESNPNTCKDTVSYVVVVAPKPLARFNVNEVCRGVTTVFRDSSEDATSYSWTFGDGNFSTQQHPQHFYSLAGSYNIMFAVQSDAGCKDTVTGVAYINPSPAAFFRFSKNDGMQFTFTDSSDDGGGNIVSWSWDFGDGNISNTQNPVHQYSSESTYTVQLCVKSDRDCESCISRNVAAVGIDDMNYFSRLSVYPNPGSGLYKLNANYSIQTLQVLNAWGQNVMTLSPETESTVLNLSHLANGVYMLRVEINGYTQIIKLIKQ